MVRVLILLCLLFSLAIPSGAGFPPFIPTYWIVGTISDVTDEDGETISADGRTVVFYKDTDSYDTYNVQTTISNNKFMLNAYYIWPQELEVGETYEVVVVQGDDGYGAGPATVRITGYGYEEIYETPTITIDDLSEFDNAEDIWDVLVDEGIINEDGEILVDDIDDVEDDLRDALESIGLTDDEIDQVIEILEGALENALVLKEGSGSEEDPESGGGETPVVEPEPEIRVWFGNRLYQESLVSQGQVPLIAEQPTIKAAVTIDDPFVLASDISNYSIIVDPGTANAKTLTLTTQHMVQKTYAAGVDDEELIRSFNLQYTVSEDLSEGEHVFQFSAQSGGTYGTASSVTEYATVEVMGGPLRIVGSPLAYPSPFSITKHGTVVIQYELSQDANIDIYLIDATGRRIKMMRYDSGAEGGSAGINKVTWTGRTDQGYLAGNAIYVGTILSRDEQRMLAKLKLAIVD